MDTLLIISGILLASAALPTAYGVLKGKLSPRPISWLGWFFIMVSSLIAQINERGFDFSMSIVFGSCISCLIVFFLSITRKKKTILLFDYVCLFLGVLCLVTFFISKDAFITTVLSVLADFFVTIPTLHNAYVNPRAESLITWSVGSVATALAFFGVLKETEIVLKIFPIYLFVIYVLTFLFCLRRFIVNSKVVL